MTSSMQRPFDDLGDMTAAELREKYREVFGEETHSRHKGFLRKRIVWRLRANAEGGPVLDDGFEYAGQTYRSLTAVAKAITGAHWGGFHFFGLKRGRP